MYNLEYLKGGVELLDLVKPLWEKLNAHHQNNAKNFFKHYSSFTFEERKKKFIEGVDLQIRIDLVRDIGKDFYIGYCISTFNKELIGEIDSLYIEEEYRHLNVGTTLMESSLGWLDANHVKTKFIAVAEGNEVVFEFYQRYGFYPRRTILEQINS